jgi:hypothetical protein
MRDYVAEPRHCGALTRDERSALQHRKVDLTCQNTRKQDETGSLIYFYSSYLKRR